MGPRSGTGFHHENDMGPGGLLLFQPTTFAQVGIESKYEKEKEGE